jgi:pimeloyl-ACP methyl ester carboxylesterase
MDLTEGRIEANGLLFGYLETGPSDGPLALCLHGFPDSAWTWRHLLPDLADAGYRAVAPFMRGYAPTEIPADGAFHLGTIVSDACELHDALGGDERAVLIGHDWGAAATYGIGAHQPERWRRLVTMAVPPTPVAGGALLSNFEQQKRSWYYFFLQLPFAEMVVGADDMAFIERLWGDWSPGFDGSDDLVYVKEALRDPANLAAAIGYYRASLNGTQPPPQYADAQAAAATVGPLPTLYLHGADDGCMGVSLAPEAEPLLAEGSEVVIVPDAGHFLQLERPKEVNDHILRFLDS